MQAQESFLEVAGRIGTLQRECGLPMPVGDYVDQFHFGLMEVVFEWARGMVCTGYVHNKRSDRSYKSDAFACGTNLPLHGVSFNRVNIRLSSRTGSISVSGYSATAVKQRCNRRNKLLPDLSLSSRRKSLGPDQCHLEAINADETFPCFQFHNTSKEYFRPFMLSR